MTEQSPLGPALQQDMNRVAHGYQDVSTHEAALQQPPVTEIVGALALDGAPEAPPVTPAVAEREAQIERLRQMVFEGEVNAHVWISQTDIDPDMGGGGLRRFQTFYSNPDIQTLIQDRTPETLKEKFTEQGVTQLLTAEGLEGQFGTFRPDTDKPTERAWLMTYETAVTGYGPLRYNDANGRRGSVFRWNLILPRTTTVDFLKMIQADPTLLQDTGDLIMRDRLQAGDENWAGARPPYEEWAQKNGGQVKTALRYDLEATPEESMIVTVDQR